MLWISCATLQKKTPINPPLNFPSFPNPVDENGEDIIKFDSNNNFVIMPVYYFLDITDYVNDVEEQRKIFEAWKAINYNKLTDKK